MDFLNFNEGGTVSNATLVYGIEELGMRLNIETAWEGRTF